MALVHSPEFIDNIHNSPRMIAEAAEVFLLRYLPIGYLKNNLLTPFKWHTSGSIVASYVALQQGAAVNIGGGFHHASSKYAQGFCLIADISLIMKYLWLKYDKSLKFLIVDLDAHQGKFK